MDYSKLAFAPPLEPMLAKLTTSIPRQPGWEYEPKWDGFRAIVYFDGAEAYLQSRERKPLARYFPELQAGLEHTIPGPVVLDGEIVIMGPRGLDFDALQMRIHPAESRVRKLAAEMPASFVAFDLLADGTTDLRDRPFRERRERLVRSVGEPRPPLYLTPSTDDRVVAEDWFHRFEGAGFDGVIARPVDAPYQPGVRALAKIKHLRTADCVVGGFRWLKDHEGESIGSLLLGLHDARGVLHHVGHTASFSAAERRELTQLLQPYLAEGDEGFGEGRTPGTPSRWNQGKDASWVRLRPGLVCEVSFDHLQGGRFRHAARFLRWRLDKAAGSCGFDQLAAPVPAELWQVFAS
jgi:ATP-dependent DNA ligase